MVKVLIFGGSGYLGNAIFKELNPFYDVYGTYFNNIKFKKNKRFFYFDLNNDLSILLKKIQPTHVISSLKGDFNDQTLFHIKLIKQCDNKKIRFLFVSSSNVFDSFTNYPSYENDKTFSESIFGRFKINIENKILRMRSKKWVILRSPMIFDKNSPRINDIIFKSKESLAIEIFPNLIVNINSSKIFAKQIHYIISRNINGIVHHGSKDLVNHDEYIFSIIKKLNIKKVNYKYIYTTNENRYLALFSNKNILPDHLHFSYHETLDDLVEK